MRGPLPDQGMASDCGKQSLILLGTGQPDCHGTNGAGLVSRRRLCLEDFEILLERLQAQEASSQN